MLSKVLKVVYAAVAVKGLLSALAPRLAVKLNLKLWALSLKNTADLEPRDWYVTATRAAGVGMLAAGGVGLLLTGDDDGAAPEDTTETDSTVDPIDISEEATADDGDAAA